MAASHAARRRSHAERRRRWPWAVAGSALVVLAGVAAAGLWQASGLIGDAVRAGQPDPVFPLVVSSVDAAGLRYSGGTAGPDDQGLMGIATTGGGYVQTTDPVASGAGTSRTITGQVVAPPPEPGEAAALDAWYFPRDPRIGLGLEFEEVTYDGPGGPAPAWLVPGTSSTWVVFVHGRRATPAEGLRIAETVSGLGNPMLLVRYRDDARAPQGDGYAGFGADEWTDLEAAVRFALDGGAGRIVLAGAGSGGSIVLAFLQNSPLADRIVGAFLDSPVTDLGRAVRLTLGMPAFVAGPALRVAAWRYGLDLEAADHVADAASLRTPILIVHGTADGTVPAAVSEEFAATAPPGLVDLELFDGAGHGLSWNTDPDRYRALLAGFLQKVAPG
ncbi:MAG: alpha/beta hydrolase [Actinomycetota bacterium]|nr:alpha/beta hydrolase [Actinomycetota bacterium]